MSPSIHSVTRRAVGIAGRLKGMAEEAIVDGVYPWKQPHPATFKPWVRRAVGRPSGDFPPAWRADSRFPFAQPSRVAVLVHVYYPDLVDELAEHLRHIPVAFDVVATNASGEPLDQRVFAVGNAVNVVVLDVENRGRDIFPMIQVVIAGLLDPYLMVL